MSKYSLQPEESVLYEGAVLVPPKKEKIHLMLTNLNIVLSYAVKTGLFAKAEEIVEAFPVQAIKIYQEKPQIIQKGNDVQIFFRESQLKIHFESILELSKFKMAILKLATGKSVQARGAEKVKGAIGLINDTLGVDTVHVIGDVLEHSTAGSLLGGLGAVLKAHQKAQMKPSDCQHAAAACDVGNSKAETGETPQADYDAQLEALKKFKELLDAGVISQEEFAAKKKEILGL